MNSVVLLIMFSLLPAFGARYKYPTSGWLAGRLNGRDQGPQRLAAYPDCRTQIKTQDAGGCIHDVDHIAGTMTAPPPACRVFNLSMRADVSPFAAAMAPLRAFGSITMASSFRELIRSCLLTVWRSTVAHTLYQ